jgi:toxin HigB-1
MRSFRHRGLKALYEGRTERRVSPQRVAGLRDILAVLDRNREPDDMNLPGFRLHPLMGELKGCWAISVSGNWRVTFALREATHTMWIISTITRKGPLHADA